MKNYFRETKGYALRVRKSYASSISNALTSWALVAITRSPLSSGIFTISFNRYRTFWIETIHTSWYTSVVGNPIVLERENAICDFMAVI